MTATGRLLIDGKLVDGEHVFATLNPATGAVFGHAPDATMAQAGAAVAAARRAFDETGWTSDRTLRLRCLDQLHHALLEHREELRELTIAEAGATRTSTHANQLETPFEIIRYYADLLPEYSMTERLPDIEIRGRTHRRWIEKEAAGVVAAIVAYNYPTQLALAKLAPALAAGCTVVLKGAPDTPLITLALGTLIAEHTDIPPGVVNVLTSSGPETGQLLTAHPAVDLVTFTGSTATGRRIMEAAAHTVKRVFLELGGKSAMVVLDDADVDAAAQFSAFSVCAHAGQGCAIATRMVVPRQRHDEIATRVASVMRSITYGDPGAPETYMGPLISERQRDKVDGMVRRAVAAGATLVTGGRKVDPGFFYTPTVLADVDADSEIAQEEVFGPVLAVIPHDGDDDAVRIANNSVYGLSGMVMSQDEERAIAVARRIRSGTFSINGGNFAGPDAPFGGYKQSGIGREMGVAGLEEFLERKTFAVIADASAQG
ncbi:aldehyde dehydrogenase family protein [Streptomyces sp. NPDC090075]|uniref:aldehyde dehydrogenase family protein n=1 Tax=Streptomyces sp. NPDC090075 TaxID=3365937 RepID=UPI00382B6A29